MKINWKFLGGEGCAKQKPSVGGVWIFSGTHNLVSGYIHLIQWFYR